MGKRRAEAEQMDVEQEAEQEQRLSALESQQAAPPAPAEASSGGLAPGVIDQLKQLGELKQQGILTEEEFETQKAKILGG